MTAILEAVGLTKHYGARASAFGRRRDPVKAVDDVSFRLERGETLALVGESGCGKSTTARLVLRLVEPSAGAVRFDGEDVTGLGGAPLRALRRRMQIVFQDPFASLDPRMTVGDIVEEPLIVHRIGDGAARRRRVAELLDLVGLRPDHALRYPHEFSGGQRQRVGIARALALEPELVVCDEPVSALDVSVQAQVVNLLRDLQRRLSLSYLFIAHDLAVVKHVADRVAVMFRGRLVEVAPKRALFGDPRHPYTRLLLAAIPRPDPRGRSTASVDAPALGGAETPGGCAFRGRCPFAAEICAAVDPALAAIGPGHEAACHRAAELPPFSLGADRALAPAATRRLALYAARRAAAAREMS